MFLVEPSSALTPEGLIHFISDLQQLGFELVGNVREIRGEDGVALKGLHFTLIGEERASHIRKRGRLLLETGPTSGGATTHQAA